MNRKRKWAVATLAILGLSLSGLCTFVFLHLVAMKLDKPHEARIHRMAEFNRIGKTVATYLQTNQSPPRTMENLLETGCLSPAQIAFIRSNLVIYIVPSISSTGAPVILKMPTPDGPYVVELNGFMRPEHR